MMNKKVVGLGEIACSNNEEDTIITYALSSCVAVTAYCPINKVAGMIHIVLPKPNSEKDERHRPGYYATTGARSEATSAARWR
ncbi:hypothetical protein [Paenibacillus cremeus]|uniref:Chemotaxis protein CheD n=1 Tax=Paenibacillus cremeus TaxID=2163881 RepID=A0A559JMB5_9BACL|nr:hypothetical protein [Paenibacillus cremeus]TVY01022.1 hypothetical protein FPZ49_32745 [Paenibacillus cremeus]